MDDEKTLDHLSEFIKKNPELGFSIEDYTIKVDLKKKIAGLPSKGSKSDVSKIAKKYSKKALEEKKPMMSYLKTKDFDIDEIKKTALVFLDDLIRSLSDPRSTENEEDNKIKIEEINKYIDIINLKPKVFRQIISAELVNDFEWLISLAERSEADPLLMINLGSTYIQPFAEELRRLVDTEFREEWFRKECPVCGRKTTVGKLIDRKRYFVCNFCSTEYRVPLLICNYCDNSDQHELAFYSIKGLNNLHIDFCKKCSHYMKMIDEDKTDEHIPSGLEDIFTLKLDIIAQKQDLIRDI